MEAESGSNSRRAHVLQRQFQRTRAAAVVLQAAARGRAARKAYLHISSSVVVCIQVRVLAHPL